MQCVEIPVQTTAGLSFQARATDTDRPAPEWALSLHLRGPSAIDLAADAAGLFTATAAATAEWTPGAYWWAIRATRGADVHEIERGDMIVAPDMVAASGSYDGRSENAKALAAIDAVLAKRATLDQERYRINNRELYRTPIADLLKLRTYYAAAVAREKRKAGGTSAWGGAIKVQFS